MIKTTVDTVVLDEVGTVRAGDRVRVRPTEPGVRNGFEGTFRRAVLDEQGSVAWVEIYGTPKGFRAVPPERIEWATSAGRDHSGDADAPEPKQLTRRVRRKR